MVRMFWIARALRSKIEMNFLQLRYVVKTCEYNRIFTWSKRYLRI